ncbi:centrosome and spindle pole-associated protein 1 isoform X11 [Podarcis raffonei]|uniref:centrosome and spindle pole-associated protein 1 isoform X11 n=1 Tax=Podarcis raffonei TaxID=65483 RepID=UPI0023291C92|nr:centrosome and spindle pole-associated protein 1 isoform X11 [Podarcis raffonei]
MMPEDLDQFLEEQKAKLAQDKAKLDNDPPYMEMQNKSAEKLSETSKMLIAMAKENIPPNSQQTSIHDYGLSLPLGEEYENKKHKLKEELRQDYRRYLSQDRLRLERNKEYNQYLREREDWNERLRRVGKKHAEHDTDTNKKGIAVTRSQPALHTPALQPPIRDEEFFKKDACTSTDTFEELSDKRQSVDQHHKPKNDVGHGDTLLHKQLDEVLNISNRKHQRLDSRPETFSRRHHRFDEGHDPEIDDEMDPRFRYESDYDRKPLRVFHAQRSQGTNEQAQAAAGSVPYATGLIIGGQDRELIQRRKEQYRRELMEQIAEQQRNKRREKELELPVAASGVVDPEKKPNRLKELGLTPRISEERIPPERPRPAFQTPTPGPTSISAPPISPVNEEFHRGLSTTLGEMLAPRIAPLPPPPPPPILIDNYRTPYDDAYFYYGARNPLDPSLAYYGPGVTGMQPSSAPPPVDTVNRPPPMTASKIGTRIANDRPKGLGMFPEEKPKTSKEATLAYQQELQQQIREREERRRQEKEEKERYEAKLEAEMRTYNPWGKGGGGAPLRDKKGNLISFTYTQTSPFARGNIFGETPTPEQLRRQESYKNFLRFQIEEKRKREEEEREKRRLEEEREEKRLAEQRAKIQREYDEEIERKRRREEEQRLKNEELYRLAEERRKEGERKRAEEEERLDKQLQQNSENERQISRQPSPLIPSPQNKAVVKEERALLVESRMSYYTHDVPRIPSPPVPARRNQLRAYEEKKNVISELSEMRKQLRSEERRLQEELLKVHSDDDDMPAKGRRKDKYNMDVFEMARLRMQAPVRRPSSKDVADPINVQNIREFNELKYKESDTRVETRYMYPDPPTTNDALDIQQQALLREQNKKLKKLRKNAEAALDFDEPVPGFKPRDRGMVRDDVSNSLLESDSAFIGTDGETFPILEDHDFNVNSPPPPPVSARERRREKKMDAGALGPTPPLQTDNDSLHSNSSLNIDQLKARNEERLRRLNELQKKAIHIADDVPLGNADDRRPSSVDTVATEPWLRPGTSETLRRFMAEQSSQAKLSSEMNLPFNWQGLSTAHG